MYIVCYFGDRTSLFHFLSRSYRPTCDYMINKNNMFFSFVFVTMVTAQSVSPLAKWNCKPRDLMMDTNCTESRYMIHGTKLVFLMLSNHHRLISTSSFAIFINI